MHQDPDGKKKAATAVAADAVAAFNEAFAAWATHFEKFRNRLELDELIGAVAPWVAEAHMLNGEIGLPEIGCRGEQLHKTLNFVLDGCELCCARLGVRLAEVLICLEGVEDLLVGLMLLAEKYVPLAGMQREFQSMRGNQ